MRFLLLFFFAFLGFVSSSAESMRSKETSSKEYHYRLTLTDKKGSPYSLSRPQEFLSDKSLERRKRLGIKVDKYDLPIPPAYLEQIRATGATVLNCSKWNNTVQVSLPDTTDTTLGQLQALPFVSNTLLVYTKPDDADNKTKPSRRSTVTDKLEYRTSSDSLYGLSQRQADMLNVPALHALGFKGEGMTMAIIDGGFHNADAIKALKSAKILGTRNFVRPDVAVYDEHPHGMMVLSCIAPNVEKSIVGTAPEASFYLFVSEDTHYEYRGEEDNWCAAVEYADSLGVDIISSSLGYTHFDTPQVKLEYHWLDGEHELNSREASLMASRGIMLCNSAGNEGDSPWKKVGFPADGKDILSVGAVDSEGVNTNFSSIGHSADGRIKPDAMAMGGHATVLGTDGCITTVNGTSFSCPILAGAVTCLMQAHPNKKPEAIIDAIHRAGSNFAHPDNIYGYGIPDLIKAHELLNN